MTKFIFEKYEHLKRLATGGMGEVHLARQRGLAGFDRLVILKTLLPELSTDKSALTQFLDEARVIGSLNHPNVISVIEVGRWENTHYIAMEYVDGPTLSEIWRCAAKAKRGLPYLLTIRIIREAALGLAHAHQAKNIHEQDLNIVHRDVSPQNIMVRRDGLVKVVDFGIAKSNSQRTVSGVNTIKGKLHYMSPEQLRNKPIDGKSDQFALGIILWELTTGKRLFKGKTEKETIHNVLKKEIAPPTSFIDSYPIGLERTVMRMLERNPSKRFSSCDEAASELRAILRIGERKSGVVSVKDFLNDLMGPLKDWDALSQPPDPSAATQEYLNPPGHLLHTEDDAPFLFSSVQGTFLVEKSDGALVEFNEIDQISDWIMSEQLGEWDLFSDDGVTWSPLKNHHLFQQSFHAATQGASLEQPVQNPAHSAPMQPRPEDGVSPPRLVSYSGIVFLDDDSELLRKIPSASPPSKEPPKVHSDESLLVSPKSDGPAPAAMSTGATNSASPNLSAYGIGVLLGLLGLMVFFIANTFLFPETSNLSNVMHLQSQADMSETVLLDVLYSDDQTILRQTIARLEAQEVEGEQERTLVFTLLMRLSLLRNCLEEYRLEEQLNNRVPDHQAGRQLCQRELAKVKSLMETMRSSFPSSPFLELGRTHLQCIEQPGFIPKAPGQDVSEPSTSPSNPYDASESLMVQLTCQADKLLWSTEVPSPQAALAAFPLSHVPKDGPRMDMRIAYAYASVWSVLLHQNTKNEEDAITDKNALLDALWSLMAKLPRDKKTVLLERWAQRSAAKTP